MCVLTPEVMTLDASLRNSAWFLIPSVGFPPKLKCPCQLVLPRRCEDGAVLRIGDFDDDAPAGLCLRALRGSMCQSSLSLGAVRDQVLSVGDHDGCGSCVDPLPGLSL